MQGKLGIGEAKLACMVKDYYTVNRRFSEDISFWLKENTQVAVSWNLLIDILESPFVNVKGLANKLREILISLPSSVWQLIHSDNQPEAIVEESEQSDQNMEASVAQLSSSLSIEGECISANMLDLL